MFLSLLPKNFRPDTAALKTHRHLQVVGALILALFWLTIAQAVVADIQCLDGNSQHCVVIHTFEPATARGNAKVLVVFLQGESRGKSDLPADSGTAFNLSQQLKSSTISLQLANYRSGPGIADATGGNAGVHDDDYTPGNVATLATALDRLRVINSGKKILLIGHSGGAVMAALLASRFPASADAYLLAACPCDVPHWQQSRNAPTGKTGRLAQGLSAHDEVDKIKARARIAVVVGNKDDNTPAKFSEAYVSRLQRQGVNVRLTYALGATHVSVLRSPEFFMLARQLAADLST
ncbi:MAG: prolyl oligopeptidase family serine peptidase [Polaromonas sp.]